MKDEPRNRSVWERMKMAFRQDTIQKAFQADSRFSSDIRAGYNEASKCLARFLLENGFVKHQVIANGTSPYIPYIRILHECDETGVITL